MTVTNVLVIKN